MRLRASGGGIYKFLARVRDGDVGEDLLGVPVEEGFQI